METVQRVIVIGSNSFSGAHFVDYCLNLGMNVIGISRSKEPDSVFLPYKWKVQKDSKFLFFQHDLNTEFEQIKERIQLFQPDFVVNFAAQGMVAQSWENPEQWFNTNTLSNVRLHQFLKTCSCLKKYVQISTPEVYGSCEGSVKENTLYNPSTPYAVSKAAADMSLMTFYREYGFPVVFIRSANVYGPGQLLYRIIPRASLFFLLGKPIELHGGGTSVRSFIHIRDVCEGIVKVMLEAKPGNIYHLATQESVSIRSLVEIIAQKTDRVFLDYVHEVGERPGKDKAYLLDCTKVKNELGWESTINLNDGLDQTIGWIKKYIEIFKNQPFDYHYKP
ncbi:MAG: GDP-mannose 4,6-dehydratase [Desulfobacula sp.]|uniref:GDP-mannose 4,6-dehydratase n=1 Tax=Desulfobacula sp. TaxID=2593537 RepID=UPI0025BA7E2E|nr:GDP-mannose 4,6-dehydratase [Desulfobacula sp.]MCD4722132.1 GDP-mannose 4,6-dehydratase [Desulfobacula sp.]